jgi:pimeloyl-ACP methyl ester carboxylesterase
LIVPDLRGHGRSPLIRGPIDVHDFARDVAETLDAAGITRCGVVGFSLGGVVAQALTLDFPARVERLAVIGTVCGRTAEERTRAIERIDVLERDGAGVIAEANRTRWFTDEFRAAYPDLVEARVEQVRRSDPESYLRAYTVFATADFADLVGDIEVPILIITGEGDVAATPRMAKLMEARARRAEAHILPGLRHSLLIEAPEAVSSRLGSFFA